MRAKTSFARRHSGVSHHMNTTHLVPGTPGGARPRLDPARPGARRLAVLLTALLSMVGTTLVSTTPPADAVYNVQPGPIFNNPFGTYAEKYRGLNHIVRAINHARPGGTIRVATWALNHQASTDALVKAHRRGVNVRIVVRKSAAHTTQVKRLSRVLGRDLRRRSHLRVCERSCRWRGGEMHSKFVTITRSGQSRDVVIVSSGNIYTGTAERGFNDVYTVLNRPRLFNTFTEVFEQMVRDRVVKNPYVVAEAGNIRAHFFPRPGRTRTTDTVYQELERVRCFNTTGGAGVDGRTVIHVSMYYWSDRRGELLAEKLNELDNRGCIVKVTFGPRSYEVFQALKKPTRNGGIELYDSRLNTNYDGKANNYVHTKYMLINGFYAGDSSSWTVFTGSHNWTRGALRNGDEVMLRIASRGALAAYRRNFNDVIRIMGLRPTRTAAMPTPSNSYS